MRHSALLLVSVVALGCVKKDEGLDAKTRADGHYLQSQAARLEGKLEEARQHLEQVKTLNPDDARLPAAEGELLLAEVKLEEATAAFERAASKDPSRATNFSRLAYLYGLLGLNEKSRLAAQRALALNPTDFNALESLAEVELEASQLPQALDHFIQAAQHAPVLQRADLVLRAVAELEKRKAFDGAFELLEASIKEDEPSAPLSAELAERLVARGRHDEALRAYRLAAEHDRTDPTLWELVGELELRRGHVDAAEAAFRRSLELKNRAVVHVALARLCQQVDDAGCVRAETEAALTNATGEELRESLELSALLASVGRKRDALLLLRSVSEEPEQARNVELHLRTARLAHELHDEETTRAACLRATATGHAGTRCP